MQETVQTLSKLSQTDGTGVWVAVLSAGGAQHGARRGRSGSSTVMGVVVIWWGAREDGVSIGRGAAELEPPQVLGVNGFVTLQHFDGLVHGEPLPLTTCRWRQRTEDQVSPSVPSTQKMIESHWTLLSFIHWPILLHIKRQNETVSFNAAFLHCKKKNEVKED